MDTRLAISSRRDVKRYAGGPLRDELVERILDAGRLSGSARNRQPWRFVVVESPEARERVADAAYAPDNVRGAALVVAVMGNGFDVGRAAQNMLLAAWNEGVASTPNGIRDPEAAVAALGEAPGIVLSFGYPARPRDPEARSAEEWSTRANRKPLGELVSKV